MNRRYLLIALLLPTAASAQYVGPNAQASVTTAVAASKAADDTPVMLEGVLVQQLKADRYEFRDRSGTITVEIDPEDFPKQQVDATTPLRLYGEIDRDWAGMVEVDVERVELLKP
ncbi:NirD/YgiW/YdeI family stress tolerance protein [Lysobacter sp.]|uniref:YgiW/YdeI family stress tolerance OB fold protein n=1 Tax=Lysobacter sp. TaxID=72226 RepID=UPI002D50DC56|nr:NirD/YgiW/YdeI family stress tolerance protein [Lysobacter sp.]HZX78230.1 NirD/YgiW/YdeI family stress tolerance protein [Lysobacter sp.]